MHRVHACKRSARNALLTMLCFTRLYTCTLLLRATNRMGCTGQKVRRQRCLHGIRGQMHLCGMEAHALRIAFVF